MIAAISPATDNWEETLGTLQARPTYLAEHSRTRLGPCTFQVGRYDWNSCGVGVWDRMLALIPLHIDWASFGSGSVHAVRQSCKVDQDDCQGEPGRGRSQYSVRGYGCPMFSVRRRFLFLVALILGQCVRAADSSSA